MSAFSGMQPFSQPRSVPGTGYKQLFQQQFTPEQMQLFNQLFSQTGPQSYLSRLAGGDKQLFNEIEAPALSQFGQLQGNLASRFSGMGTTGARRSSGFQQASSSAASDLAQKLQAQRQGLQRQALQDLMGMSQQLLGQRPYESFLLPEQKPFWQELAIAGAGGAGQALGGLGTFGGLKGLGLLG